MPKKTTDKLTANKQDSSVLLLSDKNSQGINLSAGTLGGFTAIKRNDSGAGLQDMLPVVDTIQGKANARNSIPSVNAQILCFRYMMDNIAVKKEDVKDIFDQWCGAVCFYALFPLLKTIHSCFMQKTMGTSELTEGGTPLGKIICEYWITRLQTKECTFLCYNEAHKEPCPLVYCSDELLVIPSAAGEQYEKISEMVPWVDKKTLAFTNPVAKLSEYELEKILTFLDGKNKSEQAYGQALTILKKDISDRISALKGKALHPQTRDAVLKAILLRDVMPERVAIYPIKKSCAQDSGIPMEAFDHSYVVLFQEQVIAFLNETYGIQLFAPEFLVENPAFEALKQNVDTTVKKSENAALCERLQKQLADHFDDTSLADQGSAVSSPKSGTLNAVDYAPWERKKGEAAFLKNSFAPMNDMCGCFCDEKSVFTSKITIFTASEEPEYADSNNITWSVVKNETDVPPKKALLPLTESGATIVRNGERLQAATSLSIEEIAGNKDIKVTLKITHVGMEYLWEKTYASQDIVTKDTEDMPAICHWPNEQSTDPQEPWQLFYTHVNFRESNKKTSDIDSRVYNEFGVKMGSDNDAARVFSNQNMYYRWKTHKSKEYPSFCILLDEKTPVGCVLFSIPGTFANTQNEVALAVDFGTTSTTGAVKQTGGNTLEIPQFAAGEALSKWSISFGEPSKSLVLYQFISDGLNHQSACNPSGAFFTVVADLTAPLEHGTMEKLFKDGHIFFYGNGFNTFNPMGNHRYAGLKMQNTKTQPNFEKACITLFLRQVLIMYMYYCRKKSYRVSSVRFAYPLCFDQNLRERYQQIVDCVWKEVAAETGAIYSKPLITNESHAVCKYFTEITSSQAGVLENGIITLDIGGGTADYSFLKVTGKQKDCKLYSCGLGGRMLLGRYAYQCKVKAATETAAFDWFKAGFEEIQGKPEMNDEVDEIKKFLDAVQDEKQTESDFLLSIDRVIALNKQVALLVLQTASFQKQYDLLVFEFALLVWFAALMVKQNLLATGKKSCQIYFAGNGSNIYTYMLETQKEMINKTIEACFAHATIKIFQSKAAKREVAEGLLYLSDFDDIPEKEDQQEQKALWQEFSMLLTTYADELKNTCGGNGTTNCIYKCLRKILDDDLQQTQEAFEGKVNNMKTLCDYLPTFCDILINELVSGKG